MNIEAYISSGILEAYAFGDLTAQESAEVEKNLAQYPALREELAAIEATQESFLQKAAITPRGSVKAQLFRKIDGDASGTKVVPLPRETVHGAFWQYAAAASIAVALVSTYLAFDYHARWKRSENSLGELIAQNQRVASEYNTVNQRLDKIERDIKVIDNPAFTRVIMKGTENAPEATAYVYWNESNHEVYVSIQNMRKLSQDNQYQLWAIINGKPVDAGVFDNIAGLIKMKDVASGAATFAVTIEPRGGKPAPSLETMQAAGNVVKG